MIEDLHLQRLEARALAIFEALQEIARVDTEPRAEFERAGVAGRTLDLLYPIGFDAVLVWLAEHLRQHGVNPLLSNQKWADQRLKVNRTLQSLSAKQLGEWQQGSPLQGGAGLYPNLGSVEQRLSQLGLDSYQIDQLLHLLWSSWWLVGTEKLLPNERFSGYELLCWFNDHACPATTLAD